METLEGLRSPEQDALETNKLLINQLSEENNVLALQIFPGMFYSDTVNGDVSRMLRFQLSNLLGEADNRIKDVFYHESTRGGEKVVGTTQVYELPADDESESAYLAVNYGANAHDGALTLTASREHPYDLFMKSRQDNFASSNPVRSLFSSLGLR